ncbi:MAG: hypothetical protein ACJ8AW_40660 [Rhodopila sp.]
MLWLFTLACLALLLRRQSLLPALVAGFASVTLLDPVAARHDEVPGFFARLRPPQMSIALVSLMLLFLASPLSD